jgi:hypothetical protein
MAGSLPLWVAGLGRESIARRGGARLFYLTARNRS